jgi:hypothetical protein
VLGAVQGKRAVERDLRGAGRGDRSPDLLGPEDGQRPVSRTSSRIVLSRLRLPVSALTRSMAISPEASPVVESKAMRPDLRASAPSTS